MRTCVCACEYVIHIIIVQPVLYCHLNSYVLLYWLIASYGGYRCLERSFRENPGLVMDNISILFCVFRYQRY